MLIPGKTIQDREDKTPGYRLHCTTMVFLVTSNNDDTPGVASRKLQGYHQFYAVTTM